MTPPFLTVSSISLPHGFFTRLGGVSEGPFASLNCNLNGADDPARVVANRARAAAALGVAALVGLTQVHGTLAVTLDKAWRAGEGPEGDALATKVRGLALGIVTADCAPVLLADEAGGVIGAAHAGWRGALAGILEAAVAAMAALGAARKRIAAAIGPAIGPASYEVGEELRAAVMAREVADEVFFAPGQRPGHWQFDLPGYCARRLRAAGVEAIETIAADTCAEKARFFSYRRCTLASGGPIGHQISAIALP